MLAGLLADSVRVWHAPRSFRTADRDFPHGAFIVRVTGNRPDVHERVRQHVEGSGARVSALGSALPRAAMGSSA